MLSEGIKSTALVAIGNVVSTGLGAVAMILIFRLLSPTDFGIFSAVFALMMVGVKLADFGTNIALQRTLSQPDSHVKKSSKSSVWGTIFLFKLAVGFSLLIIGTFLGTLFTDLLHLDPLYLRVGSIALIGMIIYDQAVVTAQSLHRFGISVGASALQSVFKIIGIITLSYYGLVSVPILVLLYGFAPLVGSILVPLTVEIPLGKINWQVSSKIIWKIAKWTSLAIISAALADNLDVLMIQSMLSSEGTGLYSAGARITGFVAIVGYAIGTVLSVRVARYKTKEHLEAYLKKARTLALLSFFVMVLATPFAGLLITLTAGPNYLAATPVLQYLLIASGIVMATSPYVALFYTFDRPQYFAYSGIMIAVTLILGNWFFLPTYGILGAGIAKLITRILVFAYTYRYSMKIYHEAF